MKKLTLRQKIAGGAFLPILTLLIFAGLASGAVGAEQTDGTLTPWAFLPSVLYQAGSEPSTPTPTATIEPGECSTIPELIGPASGSQLNTLIPNFEWNSGQDPNATEFHLQVYRDAALRDWAYGMVSTLRAHGQNAHRPVRNLDAGVTHYWRAYLECNGAKGPYSPVWSFTTGSGGVLLPGPTMLSPADGALVPPDGGYVSWTGVPGAVEYFVQYSGGGWDRGQITAATQAHLYTPETQTSFEWWVQARNNYAWGNDSAHWHFTTTDGSSGGNAQETANPTSFAILADGSIIALESAIGRYSPP